RSLCLSPHLRKPILNPYVREGVKISVGGSEGEIHLTDQRCQHDVNLRQNSPAPAQFLENVAVKAADVAFQRPEAHAAEQSLQSPAKLLPSLTRWKGSFQLTNHWNTSANPNTAPTQPPYPITNSRDRTECFAKVIGVQQEASHQGNPICRRT